MNHPTNAEGLEVRVKSPQRAQVRMHLLSLDECVPADHPVRAVWQYVSSIDLAPFYRDIEAVKGGVGRDAVDPRILLALWLFATIEGVSSARRLAELCERDFAYQWICGEVGVNRDLLAAFRSTRGEALEALMTETIGLLMHNNLLSLKEIAQDGMRVRASAGKSSFRRQGTLEAHLEEARERVEAMRNRDDDDDHNGEQGGRKQAAGRRAAEERLARIQQALAEREKLQARKDTQSRNRGAEARVSETDPEARVMKMADGGFRPAYNVQYATTKAGLIVVGVNVTNEGSDSGHMDPMIEQIEARTGKLPDSHLVDSGFSSREDTTRLERRGVKVYSPVKKEKELLAAGEDPYARRRDDTDEYAAFRLRMATDEAKALYRKRAETAEFVNAGCRNRGLWRFPVRGLVKARAVALWHALAHNLQRMISWGGPGVCLNGV